MKRLLTMSLLAAALGVAETPREIVTKTADEMMKADRVSDEYTWNQKEINNELDRDGKVKKAHESASETMVFAGKRVEKVVEKDGKPLSEKDAKKEQEKVDKAALEASKLTPPELKKRLDKADRDDEKENEWIKYVPDAYHLTLLREESLNGRPVYVIQGLPDTSYSGKYAALFHRVKGTFWIDKEFYTLARMEADFLDNYSFGLFLVKVDKGTHVSFEQVRVNGEVWLPKRLVYKAQARALLKTFRAEGEVDFSDYKRFRTDSRVVSTSQLP